MGDTSELERVTAEGEPYEPEEREHQTPEDFMRSVEEEEKESFYLLEVLEENELPVAVFKHCQFLQSAGFGTLVPQGISAVEVQAACDMLGVAKELRADVLAGVRVMSEEGIRLIFEKQERHRKSGRK
jgi:hypothetical protein